MFRVSRCRPGGRLGRLPARRVRRTGRRHRPRSCPPAFAGVFLPACASSPGRAGVFQIGSWAWPREFLTVTKGCADGVGRASARLGRMGGHSPPRPGWRKISSACRRRRHHRNHPDRRHRQGRGCRYRCGRHRRRRRRQCAALAAGLHSRSGCGLPCSCR